MANKMICPAAAIAKAAKAGQGAQAAVVLAGSAAVGNAEQIAGAVGKVVETANKGLKITERK